MSDVTPPATEPPEPAKSGISRRWFLAGGGAVLLGGGAGAVAGIVRDGAAPKPNPPPAALVAAVEAERGLIADLDATTGGPPAVRRVIVASRADHAAHLAALRAVLARYDAAQPAPGSTASAPRGTPRTTAELRAAERVASSTAARRAATLAGADAVLLASIAACEATHAELLS
ncbi:MAG TPA: hypothetical protein VHS54_08805 [Jatrophihabitans sp.]|jgi:hypothetical protein|nr:hypothetical protein [Jatrophihabitans sp.]